MKSRAWIALTVTTLPLVLAVWAFWVEPSRLVVKTERISLPKWGLKGELRVAVLTDLHVGSPHNGLASLKGIVSTTNALRPDLVLIPGDLVIQGVAGGSFVGPEVIARELKLLQSPLGTYAVLGNHDWWYGAAKVAAALRANGIQVLEDSAVAVAFHKQRFWLAGVSDFTEGIHDVGRALLPVTDSAPVLLFTHNPDIFPAVPPRVALTIAGHTHGGQVNLPFFGPPIVPSRFGQRYSAGHVIERGRHLYVGTGIGTSILPVRFRVPPEVLVINIVPTGL